MDRLYKGPVIFGNFQILNMAVVRDTSNMNMVFVTT